MIHPFKQLKYQGHPLTIGEIKIKFQHFLIAFILKLLLLLFFFYEIKKQGIFNCVGFFVDGGDTDTYYNPIESFLHGSSYGEPCRMPGLLPIYYPLRLLFTEIISKNFMVFFQIIFAAISSVLLAKISYKFTASRIVYFSVLILYSLNSFVGIWDLFGLADSFSVSFFIISMYFLLSFFDTNKISFIFLSGGFLTWSLFLRPIMLVALLIAGIVIILRMFLQNKSKNKLIKNIVFFFLPFLIFDGLWTIRNYKGTKEVQPLAKLSGCFGSFPEQYYAIIKIPTVLGMDWNFGYTGQWFIKTNYNDASSPITKNHFTKSFNNDSIVSLRRLYFQSQSKKEDMALKQSVINKVNQYLKEYKSEHTLDYYLINPTKLFLKFVFPSRLDNLPFPALNKMNWMQKIIKTGYFLSLLIINFFALVYIIQLLFKLKSNVEKILFSAIPFSVLGVLVYILGFIEQRYFAPIYPFFFIFAIISIHSIFQNLNSKYKWLK